VTRVVAPQGDDRLPNWILAERGRIANTEMSAPVTAQKNPQDLKPWMNAGAINAVDGEQRERATVRLRAEAALRRGCPDSPYLVISLGADGTADLGVGKGW
jgi:hypothetical protein